MLFWESKLIHRMKKSGKKFIFKCFNGLILLGCVPLLHYIGTDNSVPNRHYHVMVMDLLFQVKCGAWAVAKCIATWVGV